MRASPAAIRNLRAAGQLLAARAPIGLDEVVRHLVAVQAQDLTAAGHSIRARSRDATPAGIRRAVVEERSVVLTWTLRGTRHLHHVDDLPLVLALFRSRFPTPPKRAEQLGIAGKVGDRAVDAIEAALRSQPTLTRDEVRDVVATAGVDPSGQAPIHLVRRAALEGILCVIPRESSEEYVGLQDWVPRAAAVRDGDAGAAELARRYLRAYGPATRDDFGAWTGLGRTSATRAFEAISDETVELRGDGRSLTAIEAHDEAEALPSPLRLVGGFDAILLAYRDRRLHLDEPRIRDVNAGGGIIKPVIVSDGRIVGTWTLDRRKGTCRIRSFRSLRRDEKAELQREIEDLARFHGVELTVPIDGIEPP